MAQFPLILFSRKRAIMSKHADVILIRDKVSSLLCLFSINAVMAAHCRPLTVKPFSLKLQA